MATGDTTLAFVQTVTGYQGDTVLTFEQTVHDIGDTALAFVQTVGHPQGDTVLAFVQTVKNVGNTALAFVQSVYAPGVVAGSWLDWDQIITVGGVDISADLVGAVSIDAERSAARVADFAVKLSGAITPQAWVGKSVTIDYVQNNGARWRRFSGVIIRPELDLARKTLKCRCTDDLQRIIDGHSNDQLKALVPGAYWSKYIFSEDNKGWSYLQDLLTTVSSSVEMDSAGTLRANSLQVKAVADFTFDENLIIDDSLKIDLTERGNLINRVNISFSARFERLFHRQERQYWTNGPTLCAWLVDPFLFPNQTMIEDAIDSAGWTLLDADYEDIWPSGYYGCSGNQWRLFNDYPGGVIGFKATAAFRWSQSVTHEFNLSVLSPASIAAFNGELVDSASYSADFETTIADWGDKNTDFKHMPAGFTTDADRDQYRNEYDAAELNNAMNCAIAIAVQRIYKTHRSNVVKFSLPLAPYLELHHTVTVNAGDIVCKGVINRINERYNYDAGAAITEVELLLSAGDVGVESVSPAWTLPTVPALPPSPGAGWYDIKDIDVHIGGRVDSPEVLESWTGLLTNYSYEINVGQVLESRDRSPSARWDQTPGAKVYPNELRLKFSAIDDDKTQNKTQSSDYSIAIAVPNNTLTMVA